MEKTGLTWRKVVYCWRKEIKSSSQPAPHRVFYVPPQIFYVTHPITYVPHLIFYAPPKYFTYPLISYIPTRTFRWDCSSTWQTCQRPCKLPAENFRFHHTVSGALLCAETWNAHNCTWHKLAGACQDVTRNGGSTP